MGLNGIVTLAELDAEKCMRIGTYGDLIIFSNSKTGYLVKPVDEEERYFIVYSSYNADPLKDIAKVGN